MSGLRSAVLSGSMMILMIVLLRLAASRWLPRRLFPALWCAAALRLLVPVSLPFALSVWNLFKATGQTVRQSAQLAEKTRLFFVPQTGVPAVAAAAAPRVRLLALIWAAGVVLLAVYFLLGAVRFIRRFSQAAPADSAFLRTLRAELPVRCLLDIRCTTDSHAPLTYGVFRAVVLLPADMLCDRQTLRMVLTHELTHIRRRDCLRKLLLTVCVCLHWWNPLCWVMVRLANRDIELACDEQTLARLGSTYRKRYALTLVSLAARQTQALPLSSCFGRPAAEERIKVLMKARKIPVYLTIVAVVLTCTLVTALATQAQQPDAVTTVQEQSVSAPQKTASAEKQPEAAGTAAQEEITLMLPQTASVEEQPESAETPTQQADAAQSARWIFPLENSDAVVTQPYGTRTHPVTQKQSFHRGVDLAADEGDNVLAVADGTVLESAYDAACGYYILLQHADGTQTGYGHLQALLVDAGQNVQQGQIIATAGSSGWATGPHLHLDVIVDGEYVDPIETLQ